MDRIRNDLLEGNLNYENNLFKDDLNRIFLNETFFIESFPYSKELALNFFLQKYTTQNELPKEQQVISESIIISLNSLDDEEEIKVLNVISQTCNYLLILIESQN